MKTIYSLFNCQYYVFKSQGQVTRLHVEVELVGDILVLIDGTQVGSLQSSILTSREWRLFCLIENQQVSFLVGNGFFN